jgi:SAM-dependent methyltransferase
MEQRFAFDQIANVYKAARPEYPKSLVEDVVSYADLKRDDRILEIGCGAGQATKSFAERRFSIVGIDPGPEMLRGARESLAGFNNVEFLETTFEKWSGKQGSFRLIIAAQSWHWVSPETRFKKAADALSTDGSLAVFGTFRWNCQPRCSQHSKKSICDKRADGILRRKLGTCPRVHSKIGLMSQGCSGRSGTQCIRGSGGTRHQATRISCVRNLTIK